MSAPTYRPGDIAMVDGKPAVWVQNRPWTGAARWRYLDSEWVPPLPDDAVGPVLGNVADIAARGGIRQIVREDADLAPKLRAYRAQRDEAARKTEAQVEQAKSDALREAAGNLYLTDEGQHNEGAKEWLHRRANLIDPRTRDSACDHGNLKSGDCGYCDEATP